MLGTFMNLLSFTADVGKSSNVSSSVPSPKFLRRAGLVILRFAIASRVSDGGATSRRAKRVGVSGTKVWP